MSQGALLQLFLIGQEDKELKSTDLSSIKPWRQLWKRETPYSVSIMDLNIAPASSKTYAQALRFNIPRKGDLITSIYLRIKAKKTSEQGYFAAEELIERCELTFGKQVVDSFSGEFIRLHNDLHDSMDERAARYRLTDFGAEDAQGTVRDFTVNLPFFFSSKGTGSSLPLIALSQMQPQITIHFAQSVRGFDPTYEPQVRVFGEYVFLDDTEREWWTSRPHRLLIPYIQTTEDSLSIEKSKIQEVISTTPVQIASDPIVSGAATGNDIITIGDPTYVTIVDKDNWPGLSTILWKARESSISFNLQGSLQLAIDSNNGAVSSIVWARTATTTGYELIFRINGSSITIEFLRDNTRAVFLTDETVTTTALTSVSADDSSYSIGQLYDESTTEVWISFNFNHNLLDISTIIVDYTIDLYTIGGKLSGEDAISSQTKFLKIIEGYSPVDTLNKDSFFGLQASSSAFDVVATDISLSTQQVSFSPVDENLTTKKTRLYHRGPIRYVVWVTTPQLDRFGTFSTGPLGSYTTRYDPLDSAQILINGKDRTEMLEADYYTVSHPLERLNRGLPSGVHYYGFGYDPQAFPGGTMNFGRGVVELVQRYKKYNPTATVLGDLRDSESLQSARDFSRVRLYSVGWNILVVSDGVASLAYV